MLVDLGRSGRVNDRSAESDPMILIIYVNHPVLTFIIHGAPIFSKTYEDFGFSFLSWGSAGVLTVQYFGAEFDYFGCNQLPPDNERKMNGRITLSSGATS